MKRVLILTSPREDGWIDTAPTEVSQGLRKFIVKLNTDPSLKFEVTTLDKVDFVIKDGIVTIKDRYNGRDLSEYDLVHFRNVTLFQDQARAIAIYFNYHGIQLLEPSDTSGPEYGKLSQMVLFALHGAAVPDTWATWSPADIIALIQSHTISYPFILKSNDGIKGHDNYLVTDKKNLQIILDDSLTTQFIAQKYIPNDGDYRVLYCGQTDPLIFKRVAISGSHLNNTSRGGNSAEITMDDFDSYALELAKIARELTQRHLAGIDVIQNIETGKWYILEVNANPALSSGSMLKRKVSMYRDMIKEKI